MQDNSWLSTTEEPLLIWEGPKIILTGHGLDHAFLLHSTNLKVVPTLTVKVGYSRKMIPQNAVPFVIHLYQSWKKGHKFQTFSKAENFQRREESKVNKGPTQ
jgi:hypothetical protein